MKYTLSYYQKSADFIKAATGSELEIGIILGTGLGPFASQIENTKTIAYEKIPNFLVSTAPDQEGKLILGDIAGARAVCMSGRFHYYEGYSMEELSIPVRVLKLLGIKALVLTNAAGAVNTDYKSGDIMIIRDHIKLFGGSPMRGPNVPQFGSRFFDISDMYSKELREIAKECGKHTPLKIHEGVYMFFPGPQFESPAEIRAARILGADAVGMSTVTEALTAAHCGLKTLGLSVITNMAAGVAKGPVGGSEVKQTADRIARDFSSYMKLIIRAIKKSLK